MSFLMNYWTLDWILIIWLLCTVPEGESWRIRCYPHVLVIGVAKCGTGAIFEALRNYVHGFVPSAIRKVHYWDFKLDDMYINSECGKIFQVILNCPNFDLTIEKNVPPVKKYD